MFKPSFSFSITPAWAVFFGVIFSGFDTEDMSGLSESTKKTIRVAQRTVTVGLIPFLLIEFQWLAIIRDGKTVQEEE